MSEKEKSAGAAWMASVADGPSTEGVVIDGHGSRPGTVRRDVMIGDAFRDSRRARERERLEKVAARFEAEATTGDTVRRLDRQRRAKEVRQDIARLDHEEATRNAPPAPVSRTWMLEG